MTSFAVKVGKYSAVNENKPDDDDELEVLVGDIIDVTDAINEEWVVGRIGNRAGMFPRYCIGDSPLPDISNAINSMPHDNGTPVNSGSTDALDAPDDNNKKVRMIAGAWNVFNIGSGAPGATRSNATGKVAVNQPTSKSTAGLATNRSQQQPPVTDHQERRNSWQRQQAIGDFKNHSGDELSNYGTPAPPVPTKNQTLSGSMTDSKPRAGDAPSAQAVALAISKLKSGVSAPSPPNFSAPAPPPLSLKPKPAGTVSNNTDSKTSSSQSHLPDEHLPSNITLSRKGATLAHALTRSQENLLLKKEVTANSDDSDDGDSNIEQKSKFKRNNLLQSYKRPKQKNKRPPTTRSAFMGDPEDTDKLENSMEKRSSTPTENKPSIIPAEPLKKPQSTVKPEPNLHSLPPSTNLQTDQKPALLQHNTTNVDSIKSTAQVKNAPNTSVPKVSDFKFNKVADVRSAPKTDPVQSTIAPQETALNLHHSVEHDNHKGGAKFLIGKKLETSTTKPILQTNPAESAIDAAIPPQAVHEHRRTSLPSANLEEIQVQLKKSLDEIALLRSENASLRLKLDKVVESYDVFKFETNVRLSGIEEMLQKVKVKK